MPKFEMVELDCPACGGQGTCRQCGGAGKVVKQRQVVL